MESSFSEKKKPRWGCGRATKIEQVNLWPDASVALRNGVFTNKGARDGKKINFKKRKKKK